jgi:spermidine synthase
VTQALLISTFIIATCGLVYELLAGTLASYIRGDSVMQFSTVIGTYLFAMGIGSFLSRYVGRGLVNRFVQVEMLVGLVGGFSTTLLFLSFSETTAFGLVLYLVVGVVGMLVGLEIPLLLRILEDRFNMRELVSAVLSIDYLGALAASIAFPLLLVPHLGLVRTAFLFGMLNVGVALWGTYIFAPGLESARRLRLECLLCLLVLIAGFMWSNQIQSYTEQAMFTDDIIFARSSPYQRIVVTRKKGDVRLFLNSHLQFSSQDEYRYHEALVFPGLQSVEHPQRVLVMGGGDGLADRELLRDPRVESITQIELDPAMIRLFKNNDLLASLNDHSLSSPRVHVVYADAFIWLMQSRELFDFMVIDFPDPSNYSLGKLFTSTFYRRLAEHLAPGGALVVQSTSPLFARRSYWCIAETIKSVGLFTMPYHIYVPSFGEWGYVLAARQAFPRPLHYPNTLRFLNDAVAPSLFEFAADMTPIPVDVNRLDNQILVRYYDEDWHRLLE